MKKLMLGLLALGSFSTFANISDDCAKELKTNSKLRATIRTINLNVGEYNVDSSKGYSRDTGDLLISMACKPHEQVSNSNEEYNLCDEIEANVLAYQTNSDRGFSLETAEFLDKMAGSKCLIH